MFSLLLKGLISDFYLHVKIGFIFGDAAKTNVKQNALKLYINKLTFIFLTYVFLFSILVRAFREVFNQSFKERKYRCSIYFKDDGCNSVYRTKVDICLKQSKINLGSFI